MTPMVAWQIQCDWRDDRGRSHAHVGGLLGDERAAWVAFHAEHATPHPGECITVRLLRLERLDREHSWGPARDVETWVPRDPNGRWLTDGRLRSEEPPPVRRRCADVLAKVAQRAPEVERPSDDNRGQYR